MSWRITEDNKTERKIFAYHFRRELKNHKRYLENILSSDERRASLSGIVSKQRCWIWSSERQNKVYETLHKSPSVIVSCAASKNDIIGPYFFEREYDWKHIQKNASIFSILQTWRLPATYDITKLRCASSLHPWRKTIFGYEAPRLMNGEGCNGFVAFSSPDLTPATTSCTENWKMLFTVVF